MSKAVDYRDTVVVYVRSETLDDAAKSLNITKAALQGRLSALKRWGVKLPNKGRKKGLTQLEVAQLNSLIKKLQKEG